MKRQLPKSLVCFLILLKIGAFTFGGGWSIIAQLQHEFVEKRGWISREELLDITSLGRSLPGIMIINIGVMFGYRVGGPLCAVLAAFGIALPSMVVLSAVAIFYNQVRENPYIARMMVGVRAAVVPIILSAAYNLRSSALTDRIQAAIAVFGFGLCLFTPLNNILIVLFGVISGLLVQGRANHADHLS